MSLQRNWKQKVILIFLIDTSTSDTTNDIVEILESTNFDTPVTDKGYIKDKISEWADNIAKDVNQLTKSMLWKLNYARWLWKKSII